MKELKELNAEDIQIACIVNAIFKALLAFGFVDIGYYWAAILIAFSFIIEFIIIKLVRVI